MKRVLVAVLLVAATGSLAYAQGNSGKTKTPPLAPTMIVNANDKVVGPLPDHTAQAYGVTYALVDGHWWAVAVSANGFEMNNDAHASSVLYYENAQCFSQPYMYPSLSNRFSEVVPFLDRDGVFVYSDEPAYTTVTVSAKRSIWPPYSLASPGPCENYCCYSHELNPARRSWPRNSASRHRSDCSRLRRPQIGSERLPSEENVNMARRAVLAFAGVPATPSLAS